MFLQLPTPAPGAIENWLIPAAAVLSLAALAKKVFARKASGNGGGGMENNFVTKTELHHELNTVRDKIDARFLTLSEKLETVGTSIHEKLTAVESALARLDERTKQ